jgi:hypothetical protein
MCRIINQRLVDSLIYIFKTKLITAVQLLKKSQEVNTLIDDTIVLKDPLMRLSNNKISSRVYYDSIMHSIQFKNLKFNSIVLEIFYNNSCCYNFNNVKFNLDNMKRLRNKILYNSFNSIQFSRNRKEVVKNFKSKLIFNSTMKEFYKRQRKNVFSLKMSDLKIKIQYESFLEKTRYIKELSKEIKQDFTINKEIENGVCNSYNKMKNKIINPLGDLLDLNFCQTKNSRDLLNINEPLKKENENQIYIINSTLPNLQNTNNIFDIGQHNSDNFIDLALDENFIQELNDNTKKILHNKKNSINSQNIEIYDTPRRHTNPNPLSWAELPGFNSIVNGTNQDLPRKNTDFSKQYHLPGNISDISSFDFSGLYKPLITSQVEDYFDPVTINSKLRCLFIVN